VIEDVDKDRRYAIDAAIVRTMKSRKIMQHQQVCCPASHACFGSAANCVFILLIQDFYMLYILELS
jgi:hypothetical protein